MDWTQFLLTNLQNFHKQILPGLDAGTIQYWHKVMIQEQSGSQTLNEQWVNIMNWIIVLYLQDFTLTA